MEKNPISILQELCAQKKEPLPLYFDQPISQEKLFVCKLEAMSLRSSGRGTTKKEAKTAAARNLLDELNANQNDIHSTSTDNGNSFINFISSLIDACNFRNFPMPEYVHILTDGPPHMPTFTIECRLNGMIEIGKCTTKKGAKNKAAEKMLEQLNNKYDSSASDNSSIEIVPADHVAEIFKKYHKIKKRNVKYDTSITHRHNYFKSIDTKTKHLIAETMNSTNRTSMMKIDSICKLLNAEYTYEYINGHPERLMRFILHGEYDCVLSDKDTDLYDSILSYFQVMMGL